jgi:hypothetical protein
MILPEFLMTGFSKLVLQGIVTGGAEGKKRYCTTIFAGYTFDSPKIWVNTQAPQFPGGWSVTTGEGITRG